MAAVDETPAPVEVRMAAEGFMVMNQLAGPRQAAGLTNEDLLNMKGWNALEAAVKTLLQRKMREVNDAMQSNGASERVTGNRQVPEKVLTRHNPQLEVL